MSAARLSWFLAPVLVCMLVATCSCESNGRDESPGGAAAPAFVPRGGPPVIVGTALSAATGKPLSGVTLTLPDGTTGLSDEKGRFELRGMAPGLEGRLQATHPSGLVGGNRLLPLSGGRLEIVVRLARPRDRR